MHMTLHAILLSAALSWPLSAAAQNAPEQFSTHVPLATPGAAPFYRVTIPLAAYLHSAHADLRDVRVFNAAGQAVPFARLASTGSSEESTRHESLHWFPLYASTHLSSGDQALKLVVRQSTDGTLVELNNPQRRPAAADAKVIRGYVLDASKVVGRESIRALDLDWSGSDNNFQLLDMEVSDDLQHWQAVRSGVQLARLDFQGSRIERRRIEFSGVAGRYLRLLWREPAAAPQLSAASVEQTHTRWHAAEPLWSGVLTASETKQGQLTYRLPHAMPISRLRFTLPAGNVLLPVDILRPSRERQPAQRLARTVLYRIESKGRQWTQDEVALNGLALDEVTVRVDPRSGPVPGMPMSFALNPDQLVFLASGKSPFTLAVGNPAAANSALDVSTLVPDFGSAQAPEIVDALALRTSEPAAIPAASSGIKSRRGKTIALWSVLALGVAAMAAMAFQLFAQMKKGAASEE